MLLGLDSKIKIIPAFKPVDPSSAVQRPSSKAIGSLFEFEKLPKDLQPLFISYFPLATLANFCLTSKAMNRLVSDDRVWNLIAPKLNCPINLSSSLRSYQQVLHSIARLRGKIKQYAYIETLEKAPTIQRINEAHEWLEIGQQFGKLYSYISQIKNHLKQFPNIDLKLPEVDETLPNSSKVKELQVWIEEHKALLMDYEAISIWSQFAELCELEPPSITDIQTVKDVETKASQFSKWVEENREELLKLVLFDTGLTISSICKEIGVFTNLTHLSLKGNLLTELPKEISKLSKLTHLNISSNRFQNFPLVICKLEALSWLELNSNQIESLPSEIGQLKELESLYCAANRFTSLPQEMSQLTKLKKLDLSINRLLNLPEPIRIN